MIDKIAHVCARSLLPALMFCTAASDASAASFQSSMSASWAWFLPRCQSGARWKVGGKSVSVGGFVPLGGAGDGLGVGLVVDQAVGGPADVTAAEDAVPGHELIRSSAA